MQVGKNRCQVDAPPEDVRSAEAVSLISIGVTRRRDEKKSPGVDVDWWVRRGRSSKGRVTQVSGIPRLSTQMCCHTW